jgi:hypothetical protein
VREWDEGNNVLPFPVDVATPMAADLIVSELIVQRSAVEGSPLLLDVT